MYVLKKYNRDKLRFYNAKTIMQELHQGCVMVQFLAGPKQSGWLQYSFA